MYEHAWGSGHLQAALAIRMQRKVSALNGGDGALFAEGLHAHALTKEIMGLLTDPAAILDGMVA